MRKQIVGLVGSIAVNVILAAASLLVKSDVLLYAGAIGLAVTAILWIWSWAFAPPPKEEEAEAERRARRRKMLNEARQMVAMYERGSSGDWRLTTRASHAFADIRGHLSDAYRKRWADVGTIELSAGPTEPLVDSFLDELDRLEREWKLS